jgi:hypothetical protein
MPKPNPTPPLVAAAAAVDQELREYDELAREAKRVDLDGEKALARAARLLEDATSRQPQIQDKLRALVGEFEAARLRQQQSLDLLVEVSRALAARVSEFETLMRRFAALGESAKSMNQLTGELVARKPDGGLESALLEGLRTIEERMLQVVVDAELLARDAQQSGWPEIARQAEAVRQQVSAAKNKLSLAHRTVAERSPS